MVSEGYEGLMSFEEFKALKFTQYSCFRYTADLYCPGCGQVCLLDVDSDIRLIGWCDTDSGFMAVFECPRCFSKFRFHISGLEDRWDIDAFYRDFAMMYVNHGCIC